MSDEEWVFVAAKSKGGNATMLHTDSDCSRLENARKVLEKRRSLYPDDVPICPWCRGDVANNGGDNTGGAWNVLANADPEDVGLTPKGGRP